MNRADRLHDRYRAGLIALGADRNTIAQTIDALMAVETRHRRKALLYCNDPQTAGWLDLWNKQQQRDLEVIGAALPKAARYLFINQDPRGYALKINNETIAARNLIREARIYTDWGGYGILTPEVIEK